MPKKKDPAVAVVRYFETAPIEQAKLVLQFAKDALARRGGSVATSGEGSPSTSRKRKTAPAGTAIVPPPPGPLPGA